MALTLIVFPGAKFVPSVVCYQQAIVGFVGVEGAAGSIRAGVVDGVGLIRLRAAGEGVSAEQERRAGIAGGAQRGAGQGFEGGVVGSGLCSARGSSGARQAGRLRTAGGVVGDRDRAGTRAGCCGSEGDANGAVGSGGETRFRKCWSGRSRRWLRCWRLRGLPFRRC